MRCVARGRTCYSGAQCASGDAANDNDDHDPNNDADKPVHDTGRADKHDADANFKSVYAGAWNNDERYADARHGQSNLTDRAAECDDAQPCDDAAILDMSANGERHHQSELRAGNSAVNAALTPKGNL